MLKRREIERKSVLKYGSNRHFLQHTQALTSAEFKHALEGNFNLNKTTAETRKDHSADTFVGVNKNGLIPKGAAAQKHKNCSVAKDDAACLSDT